MHKPFLATLTVFSIQHDRSYNMPGRRLDDQCLPRAAAVHLIPADPWSREWGQPHIGTSGPAADYASWIPAAARAASDSR